MPFYKLQPAFPNGSLTVAPLGSSNPPAVASSIFSDSFLTLPVTQPVQLGPDGQFGFWAQGGQYVIQIGQPYNRVFIVDLPAVDNIVTATGGEFLGTASGLPFSLMATSLAVNGASANKIEGVAFIQRTNLTVGHLSVRSNVSLGAGALWSAGVYDSTGALAFWTGVLDGTITTLQTVTAKNAAGNATSYAMTEGSIYVLVTTATVVGAANTVSFSWQPSSAVVQQFINNANANRQIISATNTVNGVLPASIGSLSANNVNIAMTAVFAEP